MKTLDDINQDIQQCRKAIQTQRYAILWHYLQYPEVLFLHWFMKEQAEENRQIIQTDTFLRRELKELKSRLSRLKRQKIKRLRKYEKTHTIGV